MVYTDMADQIYKKKISTYSVNIGMLVVVVVRPSQGIDEIGLLFSNSDVFDGAVADKDKEEFMLKLCKVR